MDITPYLELKPAPRAVFERLPTHGARARFMIATPDGDWRCVTWNGFARMIRDLGLWLDTSAQTPEHTVDEILARAAEARVG